MLPEIGGSELLLIAAIALIVVGPQDLPVLMRKIGKALGRLRIMAGELRTSFDEMARQSELEDLRKEVEAMRSERFDPVRMTEEHLDREPFAMRPHDQSPERPAFDAVAAHEANLADYSDEQGLAQTPVARPASNDEPTLFDLPPPETRP